MTKGIIKATRGFALAAATGLFLSTTALTPVYAADLGGDCCADLEERVAELEATTVTKGNRKVSVKLYGMVSRAIMVWDDGLGGDTYAVGNSASPSRFGIKGSAKIGRGWSAGFLLEWQTRDTWAKDTAQNTYTGLDAGRLQLRHEAIYLKNARFGTVYIGHSSVSTDGITEIDLSGSKVVSSSDITDWNKSFAAGGATWGVYQDNLDGVRGDAIIRYDTPTYAGFTASTTFGSDSWWDVALRYAGEFGGVMKVAGGIGYQKFNGAVPETLGFKGYDSVIGSVSALHVPTGLNITVAAGNRSYDLAAKEDASYWYVKGGLLRRFNRLGMTAVYGEYGDYSGDFGLNGGITRGMESSVWGVGVVQHIDAAAMELFASYRDYNIDSIVAPGVSDQLSVFMLGARIKF